MDSVISGLNAKLKTLKSQNPEETNSQDLSTLNNGIVFKDTLRKFSSKSDFQTTLKKAEKVDQQEPVSREDDVIRIVDGKEEISLRFDDPIIQHLGQTPKTPAPLKENKMARKWQNVETIQMTAKAEMAKPEAEMTKAVPETKTKVEHQQTDVIAQRIKEKLK